MYGLTLVAGLAWLSVGIVVALLCANNVTMLGPPHGRRIFLVLVPLPWFALVAFSCLSYEFLAQGRIGAALWLAAGSLVLCGCYGLGFLALVIPAEL